jgi:hypothetical protein
VKSIIYKNPVIAAVSINILALILYIYSIAEREYWITMPLMIVGIVNRRIIDNGENINNHKKNIILISFFLMVTIFISYTFHVNNVRNMEIIYG